MARQTAGQPEQSNQGGKQQYPVQNLKENQVIEAQRYEKSQEHRIAGREMARGSKARWRHIGISMPVGKRPGQLYV